MAGCECGCNTPLRDAGRLERETGGGAAELRSALAVVWKPALDLIPEASGVVWDTEMGELVDDDVVDQSRVEHDQAPVEANRAVG